MIDHNKYNDDDFIGNDLESTNYDDSEFVFSWANNDSLIVPDLYECSTCGRSFTNVDGESTNTKNCEACGHKKTNGYRECVIQSNEKKEHMIDISQQQGVVLISLLPYIFIVMMCFFLAYKRNELKLSSGCCILFFPYMYIVYALVDWIVISKK